MSVSLAELVVGLAGVYLAGGALFAVPFAARGVARIDPLATGSTIGFRVLIVPGTMLFWPLLLLRWAAGSVAPPIETNAHRRASRSLDGHESRTGLGLASSRRPPAGGGQDDTVSGEAEPTAPSLTDSRRSLAR